MHIEILNRETGEIRDISTQTAFDGSSGFFIWEDGNYACDCNRSIFFDRAGGLDPDMDADICGTGGFGVRIIQPDGTIYYQDTWPTSSSPEPPA